MKIETEDPKVSDLPVWDKEGMLARLMDDQDLAKIITETFLTDIPQQILALKLLIDSGDSLGAEHKAHTIKGASALVGGEQLRVVAFEMEKAFKLKDLTASAFRISELETRFEKLREVLPTSITLKN